MVCASQLLEGHTVGSGWKVIARQVRPAGVTGANFSSGYTVEKDGVTAFMKAMDYSRAGRAPDLALALNAITTEILFERRVLDICAQGHLSNIVQLIDGGTYSLPGKEDDVMGRVEFFVFELADTDVRKMLTFNGLGDAAWNLRILHQTTKALEQLHNRGIAHQDIKPSNVLAMKPLNGKADARSFKVADLGRSSIKGVDGPHDKWKFAGDPNYITPEGQYQYDLKDWVDRREAADGYLLGNLMAYLFVGTPMTALILNYLDPAYHPTNWRGDFERP